MMSNQHGAEARSAVERVAAFAAEARPGHLTPEVRQLFERNTLDSVGCGIAAQPGRPFQVLREHFKEYRAPARCTLIGGAKTSSDQATLYNSGLMRYFDLLDSYMWFSSRQQGRYREGVATCTQANPVGIHRPHES
jgi:2-methylcitrate dehydratase